MITHPLDLASRLRRPPRSFDWVFFVNFGLIALFFILFGSRFVLSPALVVDGENMQLSQMPEGSVSLVATTLVVSVKANGQIFVNPNGLVNFEQLRLWFTEHGKRTPGANVLIIPDARVRFDNIARITAAAEDAGLSADIAVVPVKEETRAP